MSAQGDEGASWAGYLKGKLLGPSAASSGAASGSGSAAAAPPLRTPPKPIRIGDRDAHPELVSSPTDVAQFEIGHHMRGRKWSWKAIFEDPRSWPETPKGKR